MRKQKTPQQIKKEMSAALARVHDVISALNRAKRSFKRLDRKDRQAILDKWESEEDRFFKGWLDCEAIHNPPKPEPRRRHRRRRRPNSPLGDIIGFASAGLAMGLAQPFISRLLAQMPKSEDQFPSEIDANKEIEP